jgi:dihydroflavonol-4-reductase
VRLGWRAVGHLSGCPEWWSPPRPAHAAESLRSSLATYYGSPAKAMTELGWNCRDLDTGLGDLISAGRPQST